jgi:hypothetical protein
VPQEGGQVSGQVSGDGRRRLSHNIGSADMHHRMRGKLANAKLRSQVSIRQFFFDVLIAYDMFVVFLPVLPGRYISGCLSV